MNIHSNLEIHSESCSHGKGVHPFPTIFTVRRLEVIIQEETDAIVFLRLIRKGDSASETDTTILRNNDATWQGKRRISYIASQQFTSDIPSGCDGIRKIRTNHRHNASKVSSSATSPPVFFPSIASWLETEPFLSLVMICVLETVNLPPIPR